MKKIILLLGLFVFFIFGETFANTASYGFVNGYVYKNGKWITHTEDCQEYYHDQNMLGKPYGYHTNYSTCYCKTGYKLNSARNHCIRENIVTTTSPNTNNNSSNLEAKCGGFANSCVVGQVIYKWESGGEYRWYCKANHGLWSYCHKPINNNVVKVNGECGHFQDLPYTCASGKLSFKLDLLNEYIWYCDGINGGANAFCKMSKGIHFYSPVNNNQNNNQNSLPNNSWGSNSQTGNRVNGVCNLSKANKCKSGVPMLISHNGSFIRWRCLGMNGGSNAECSIKKPEKKWKKIFFSWTPQKSNGTVKSFTKCGIFKEVRVNWRIFSPTTRVYMYTDGVFTATASGFMSNYWTKNIGEYPDKTSRYRCVYFTMNKPDGMSVVNYLEVR